MGSGKKKLSRSEEIFLVFQKQLFPISMEFKYDDLDVSRAPSRKESTFKDSKLF